MHRQKLFQQAFDEQGANGDDFGMLLIYLVPFIMLIDIAQLLVAERFIGMKQIRSGQHPLESDRRPPNWAIAIWITGLCILWLYMILLVFDPRGALQGGLMFFVSLSGFALRRMAGLKWALVLMTIETAIRLGLLANMLMVVFFFDGRLLPASYYQ
ncbi:hypothetical protein [Cerasicoccus arenae]|uniref:Uncharacterized protein n=1 Tax=Cerasicoccus arenae TaxID=424488 RepID=A0A8J3GED3_9BACT|nr:hypothetical protein [Cerasicoccus arenae]MBK1858432.1 hypothetical protein [Cerasicoccus arenae]GHC02533.1 hypothetical protein GCM10007047_18880 [Cerasicoccus arenae]